MYICTEFYTGGQTLTSDETLFANIHFGVVPFGNPSSASASSLKAWNHYPLQLAVRRSTLERHSYVVPYLLIGVELGFCKTLRTDFASQVL